MSFHNSATNQTQPIRHLDEQFNYWTYYYIFIITSDIRICNRPHKVRKFSNNMQFHAPDIRSRPSYWGCVWSANIQHINIESQTGRHAGLCSPLATVHISANLHANQYIQPLNGCRRWCVFGRAIRVTRVRIVSAIAHYSVHAHAGLHTYQRRNYANKSSPPPSP